MAARWSPPWGRHTGSRPTALTWRWPTRSWRKTSGDTTPLHTHPDAEEAFYVLGGQVEVWAEGTVSTASAGAFVVVPRGATHGLRRLSNEPVRMITLISPPGSEKIFAEVAEQGEENLLADPDRLLALAQKHGTNIVGEYPEPARP